MSRCYLDTSAALKLVIDEPESAALAAFLDEKQPELVACFLLETELRRAVHRVDGLSQQLVGMVLDGVDLYELSVSLFHEAGVLPGRHLRSLDALHLDAAIRIGVDAVLSYDQRMTDAARALGLTVDAPA